MDFREKENPSKYKFPGVNHVSHNFPEETCYLLRWDLTQQRKLRRYKGRFCCCSCFYTATHVAISPKNNSVSNAKMPFHIPPNLLICQSQVTLHFLCV